MPRRAREIAAACAASLCALAAGLSLAACGSGGDDSISPGAVAEAATITSRVQGADMALTATVRSAALGERPLTFTGSGVQDLRHRSADITLDMSKLGSGKLESRAVNHIVYMRSDAFAGNLPDGKKWISIDLERALQAQGISPATLGQQQDVSQYLRYLKAASGRVTRVGGETVRGVRTTHYKATVDLHRLPQAGQGSAQDAQRMIQLAGTAKLPMEVWVDARHMIRRLRFQMSMKLPSGPAAGQRMKIDETADLFAFGPKPRVAAPPKDEVFDVTDLAIQQQKQQQSGG